jgi:hypothetical protein
MRIHQVSKKEFLDFKKTEIKNVPKLLKKSPSYLLQAIGSSYVRKNNILCDVLQVLMKDGSYLHIPIFLR